MRSAWKMVLWSSMVSLVVGCGVEPEDEEAALSEDVSAVVVNCAPGGVPNDSLCAANQFCHNDGSCRADKVDGESCNRNAQCKSGTCMSGTCDRDLDSDGVGDKREGDLIKEFFPWVWFDSGEDSTAPASPSNPGTALARVRKHPLNPSMLAVTYVLLYRQDAGDFGGLSSHHGDVEPFTVTLVPNANCRFGYGVWAMKTIAHEGTGVEVVEEYRVANSCYWGKQASQAVGLDYSDIAKIYVSENKHGNYITDGGCDAAVYGLENCSHSYALNFNVYNVGEPNYRFINALTSYQFPGEFAWDAIAFCGSLAREDSCPGPIRDKFLKDSLLARVN